MSHEILFQNWSNVANLDAGAINYEAIVNPTPPSDQQKQMVDILNLHGAAYLPPDHSAWEPPGTHKLTGRIKMSADEKLVTMWCDDGSILVAFTETLLNG